MLIHLTVEQLCIFLKAAAVVVFHAQRAWNVEQTRYACQMPLWLVAVEKSCSGAVGKRHNVLE